MRPLFLLGWMALGGAWIDTFALVFSAAPTWQGVVTQMLVGLLWIFVAVWGGVRLERDDPMEHVKPPF